MPSGTDEPSRERSETPLLVLVTQTFPDSLRLGDGMFVGPELPQLAAVFPEIILCPTVTCEQSEVLPRGARVDGRLAARLARKTTRLLAALSWKPFWREARTALATYGPSVLRPLLAWGSSAALGARLCRETLGEQRTGRILFYTYWNDGVPAGLLLHRATLPAAERTRVKVVSRVHGIDLFFERHEPPYIPFRRAVIELIDAVLPTSQHSKDYLVARFPAATKRVHLFRLGTIDQGVRAQRSPEGVLRVVSCSGVVPVKRVALIFAAVSTLARRRPDLRVHWTHLGGGEGFGELQEIARRDCPTNLDVFLPGECSNSAVLEHYRRSPVDVFLHLSSSEGGVPVALQEALCAGVPVIGADAGGTREAVTPETGLLLPVSVTSGEAADALAQIATAPASTRAALHEGARRTWDRHFSAPENHRRLARFLLGVATG